MEIFYNVIMNKIEEFNKFTETSDACNISAFSPEQRKEHSEATVKIFSAVTKLEENEDGYNFTIPLDKTSIEEISEWVGLETKCCSFMNFDLAVETEKEVAVLKIDGGGRAKEFLTNSPLVELAKK